MEPIQDRSGGEVPGETMEIKIKTLDSQSYTIRVAKNVAVPALKEHLATVVGVPADSQRLICRGKVLKDDQLLSAYNVEDGHTLHLVARPLLPPAGTGPSTAGAEASSGPSEVVLAQPRNRAGHVSHSLLMGTINIPDTGEGAMPDLSRIISAVLNTVGIANVGAQNTGGNGTTPTVTMGVLPTQGGETGGTQAEGRPALGEEDSQVRALELQIDALYGVPPNNSAPGVPSPFQAVQHPGVVPDVLTTMSQYLDRLEQSFSSREAEMTQIPDGRAVSGTSVGSSTPSGVDTERTRSSPAALGALVQRVNNLLRGQASSALAHLGEQLANEAEITDAAAREEVQHTAFHDGNLIQQVGALLLELGRTTLSLRMGQSPGEAVVNAGPAIFISPAGPNPIMVQPLPLQTSAAFPIGQSQPRPLTLAPSSAATGTPRSIHIHIHTSDLGAPSASPSPSLSSPPPQRSAQELALAASRASGGVTVHQMPERADLSSPSQTLTDTGITIHPVNESPGGTTATPIPPAHTGMQGSIMTFDEHGAIRVVPVHSHAGSSSGHPWASFETGAHFHPLLARFQHQFSGQPFTLSRNAVPPVSQPASTTHVAASRQPNLTTDTQQGASGAAGTGDRGNSMSGSGGVDVARLVTSVAPLLHHLAEALQNGPPPLGAQTRRRRQQSQHSEEQQRQAGQSLLRNLAGYQEAPGDTPSRNRRAPGLGNILRAAGVGSETQQAGPGILGQFMRSPAMETLVQQVMQGVGDVEAASGGRRAAPAAGQDLGGMLQHMMPMMSQVLGGGALSMMPPPAVATGSQSQAEGGSARDTSGSERWKQALTPEEQSGWSETMTADEESQQSMPPQRPFSDVYSRGSPVAKRQKTEMEGTAQRLEEGETAQEVLRSVADAAGTRVLGNSSVTTSTSLAQHVSQADGLADVSGVFGCAFP
ncbi:hypothetical protein BDL97_06G035400 [Sphagnum fallax]|nr:hypothetical protein BDL97_06G035400 [Sphagnum fallax]